VKIYDPHIQLDEIYGSNLSFVVSALPHIGKLLMRSLDNLISSSDTIVIAQKTFRRGARATNCQWIADLGSDAARNEAALELAALG